MFEFMYLPLTLPLKLLPKLLVSVQYCTLVPSCFSHRSSICTSHGYCQVIYFVFSSQSLSLSLCLSHTRTPTHHTLSHSHMHFTWLHSGSSFPFPLSQRVIAHITAHTHHARTHTGHRARKQTRSVHNSLTFSILRTHTHVPRTHTHTHVPQTKHTLTQHAHTGHRAHKQTWWLQNSGNFSTLHSMERYVTFSICYV